VRKHTRHSAGAATAQSWCCADTTQVLALQNQVKAASTEAATAAGRARMTDGLADELERAIEQMGSSQHTLDARLQQQEAALRTHEQRLMAAVQERVQGGGLFSMQQGGRRTGSHRAAASC
jgi:hypothetical protein